VSGATSRWLAVLYAAVKAQSRHQTQSQLTGRLKLRYPLVNSSLIFKAVVEEARVPVDSTLAHGDVEARDARLGGPEEPRRNRVEDERRRSD